MEGSVINHFYRVPFTPLYLLETRWSISMEYYWLHLLWYISFDINVVIIIFLARKFSSLAIIWGSEEVQAQVPRWLWRMQMKGRHQQWNRCPCEKLYNETVKKKKKKKRKRKTLPSHSYFRHWPLSTSMLIRNFRDEMNDTHGTAQLLQAQLPHQSGPWANEPTCVDVSPQCLENPSGEL